MQRIYEHGQIRNQYPAGDITLELYAGEMGRDISAPNVISVSDVIQTQINRENLHRCVIDSKKMYIEVILVDVVNGKETPQGYTIKAGETLIEAFPPTEKMVKPQWTGKEWKETATPAEIEAAEKARFEVMGLTWPPQPPPPTETEQLAMEVSMMLAMQQEQNELAITELTMLIAMGGGA